jgi:hypothetical protein
MKEKEHNAENNLGELEKEMGTNYFSKNELCDTKTKTSENPWDYEYFISFLGDETKSISTKTNVLDLIEKYNPPVYFEPLKYANSIILRFNDENLEAQLKLLESIKSLENCRIERGNIYQSLKIEDISYKQ